MRTAFGQLFQSCPPDPSLVDLLVRYLKAGDTFTGTARYDSCIDVEDHPVAIVVTQSSGNLVQGSVVSRVAGQVRSYDMEGYFSMASRKWLLQPTKHDSRSLGIACSFETDENTAKCNIMRDNFAVECGSITIKRDFIGWCHPPH